MVVGAAVAVVGGIATATASADVVSYTCPSTGCVVTVNPGLLVGASAASGSGGTYGVAGAFVPQTSAQGPTVEFATFSIGPTTTVQQGTYEFIGAAGGVVDNVGASTSSSSTTAGGQVYQYNLSNRVVASAGGGWQAGTTSGSGGVCVVELGLVGSCVVGGGSMDKAGNTDTYTITGPYYVDIKVTWAAGQPVTITSNIPLLP
jgi:hypothetical protein